MIAFLLGWPLYLLIGACLIGAAVLVTLWHCGLVRDDAVKVAVAEGFAAGRASYAEQLEQAWRPVHAVHADYVARTRQFTASAFADNGGIR